MKNSIASKCKQTTLKVMRNSLHDINNQFPNGICFKLCQNINKLDIKNQKSKIELLER